MSAFSVKGWCPGALRPMQSGDGLVVRVRPFGGRLDAAQISGLAHLAERHGNGLLDVTSRANLQIRGVSATSHRLLLDGLSQLALLDPDAETESRRNILVTPFWRDGDETQALPSTEEGGWRGISQPVQSCLRLCAARPSRRRSWPRRAPAFIRRARWSESPSGKCST